MSEHAGSLAPARGPANAPKPAALVFVRDRDSEGVIRQSLSDLGIPNPEFINGDIDTAIGQLGQRASPRLLVVDLSGSNDPVGSLDGLAEVSEPGTGVVAIGDANDIRIYRQIRDAGVAEYFFKPLVGNLVTRTFNTILNGGTEQRGTRTGKLVFVLGVRGGDGATTVAVNTAWHLAESGQRRVLLVDLDLQLGDAALQLDATPSHALREALEHPERVDELFLQRGVTQVTERLGLLASQEGLNEGIALDDKAVLSLLQTFLHRYRYVIVDVPAVLAPRLMRVLTMPSILLLVSSAGLASARDVARWRQQIGGNTPDRGTLHLLNKNGASAGLTLPEFVRAVGQAPDLIVPYEREVASASNLGIAAVRKCAGFQRGLTPLYRHLTGEAVEAPQSFLGRIFG